MRRPPSLVVALGAMLFAGAAVGAPTTTSQVTPYAGALNLGGTGSASTHIVKVADVTITTQNAGGCSVTISPEDLRKADGETPISLQLLVVSDGAAAPAHTDFTTAAGAPFTFSISSAGTHERDLYIRYSPRSHQDPGTYTSSLTVVATDI